MWLWPQYSVLVFAISSSIVRSLLLPLLFRVTYSDFQKIGKGLRRRQYKNTVRSYSGQGHYDN